MSIFVKMFSGRTLCLQSENRCYNGEKLTGKIGELEGIPASFLSLYHHGQKVCNDDVIVPGESYQAVLCLRGGKGGFGSMLRMLGAQIDKTTNHDACRDLSGRRMRDVNNEKKLSDWIHKKAEMERERQEKRREKMERLRQEPRHVFVDPSYDKQKQEVIESLDDAITQGIQAAASVSTSASSSGVKTVKRKAEDNGRSSSKRSNTLWMGVEGESDSDESEDEDRTKPVSFTSEAHTSSGPSSSSSHSIPSSPGNSSSSSSPNQEGGSDPEPKPSSADTDEPDVCTEGLKSVKTENGNCEDRKPLLTVLPPPTVTDEGSSRDCSKTLTDMNPETLDLDGFSSTGELEALGLDFLKSTLMARGMKCGGTLQQRAERLFSVKGVSPDMIDPSMLAKPSKGKKANPK